MLVYQYCKKVIKLYNFFHTASIAMLKWAKSEENLALQDVFSKVFEVSSMWTNLMKDFTEEVHTY